MSHKKTASTRLKNALNELDNAIEQWDSLTNKPEREQVQEVEGELQKQAKGLLKQLRNQLQEFDDPDVESVATQSSPETANEATPD